MPRIIKSSVFAQLKSLSKSQKFALYTIIAVIIYTLAGFFAAPPLLKMGLEKKLPEILHRKASIRKIKLNPYTLTATIENFSLQQKENSTQFVSFDLLFVDLQLSSIFKRALVIKSFQLTGPKVNFARLTETTYSFSDLLQDTESKEDREEPDAPPLFSINNVEISNGAIEFHDNPKNKIHRLSELNLAVPAVSNLPIYIDTNVEPKFSAKINGADLSLGGVTRPFTDSKATVLDLNLTKLDIPEYLAYVPNPTKATINSGTFDIKAQFSYSNAPGVQRFSLSGLISIEELSLINLENENFAEFPKIDVRIAESDLLKQEVKLESVTILNPKLNFARQADGILLPFSLFMKEGEASSPQTEEKTDGLKPMIFAVDSINIEGGMVSFVDQKIGAFETLLAPVDLKITNFSTRQGTSTDFNAKIKSESDELIIFQGQAGLDPFFAAGRLDMNGINLVKYHPYLEKILNPQITGGTIDFATNFHSEKGDQGTTTLLDGMTMKLADFSLTDGPETTVEIALLDLSDTKIDLNRKEVKIGLISSRSGELIIKRDKKGGINLARIIRKDADTEVKAEGLDEGKAEEEKTSPWLINLTKLNIEKYGINFSDEGPSEPFKTEMTDISLDLANFSSAENDLSDLSFSFELTDGGRLSGKGSLGLSPLSSLLTVEATEIALPPLQNYAADHTNIIITEGSISTRGELSLTLKDGLSAQFQGNAQVADLSLVDEAGEDLLKWKGLGFSGIQFLSSPNKLTIEEANWQDPFLKLTILKDGSLNLSKLAKHSPETEAETVAPTTLKEGEKTGQMEIDLHKFILSGAHLSFQDQKISPAYAATLDDFSGSVTGLSTKKDSLAEVKLSGKMDQRSPLKVTGTVNPLKDEIFADLKLDFQDIDLSPTSPYTGKFIGYKTDKGKLTLNLHYNIEGKEVKAKNKLFLDQFSLGEFVDSPNAVSLPIHLAIALLKNRKGEILLDIPVAGNLSDPKFSITSVVFKAILNLIAKAATSPFALLGALIPEGKDLQHVSFTPGSAEIEQKAEDKLTKMASVLYERPGLRMDIKGGYSPEQDRRALEILRLNQQVKLQKIKAQSASKKDDRGTKGTTVSAEEYPHYLTLAYQESINQNAAQDLPSKDPGLKNQEEPGEDVADGGRINAEQVAPTVELMEKEIIRKIAVTEEDLRLLAIKRATNVLDFLAKKGAVEPERLFLIEPKSPAAKKTGEAEEGPQVNLIIK